MLRDWCESARKPYTLVEVDVSLWVNGQGSGQIACEGGPSHLHA